MRLKASEVRAGVVGREPELAQIERLLSAARERFAALLLEGEPGIGKTTVFREALRSAEAKGFHVASCRPGASDSTLSLAAVGDLLHDLPAEPWQALPAPQRRALEVALLLIEPGERAADQRALAAGVRSLVGGLAAERPVLLAVDDVQWLDPASATILEFVLRRLGPERVGLLATRRLSEPAGLDVEAVVPPDVLARERVGPLSLGALRHLLGERLGVALPRPTLVHVHATARGNPLFALEIGRVLADRGTISPGEPLPVPDDIRELVGTRVAALSEATRELLLGAALLAQPATKTLAAALGRPPDADLEPAERAGIAVLEGGLVAFAHPLHAAAVVAGATAAERRRMHRRLSDAVREPEERARHLASGAGRPDDATARVLEDGAAVARARGGLNSAAELLERARALTPAGDIDRARDRGIRSAELHIHAGDRGRARTVLQELLGEALADSQRAEALRLLGELSFSEEDLLESERLLTEALAIASDPRSSARIQLDLLFVVTQQTNFARAAELGHRALASLQGSADGPLLAEALAYCAMADFLCGRGVDWAKVERALALEDPDRIAPIGLSPSAVAAILMMHVGRYEEARRLCGAIRTALVDRGDEGDLSHLLVWFSWLETRCGNFAAAARLADEAITCAGMAGSLAMRRVAVAQRAWVDAFLGRIADARRRSAEAVPPDERGGVVVGLWIAAALGLAELSVGDPAAAWAACRPIVEALEQYGIDEPVPLKFLPEALEALVELDQLDRAESLLDAFERRGRELDRSWAIATAGRCRGLLLAARGDLPGAVAALDGALAEHERLDAPFERARTLLVKGVVERRARRRARARMALEEAAREFERMGTRLWAERARNELDHVGGRRPRPAGELTRAEQRAVELAAEGLSNKEIARALFVSVHTVEVHLSRAYAKLGVHSRAQLARHLATRG